MTVITSPDNDSAQEGPQARGAPLARQDARVRGRGRGPDRRRPRRPAGAALLLRAGAARASTWRRTCCARSPRSARARARSASTASAGRPRPPARCASRCGASTTPATWARCCARRSPSARAASRSGPGTADPFGPKAVRASMGALFAVPVVRVGAVEELPGRAVALVARAGRPLCEALRRREVDARGGSRARGAARDGARRLRRGRPTSPSGPSRSTPPWRRRSRLYEDELGCARP